MDALCTFISWTCSAVAVRRGLWDCPSPTAAGSASRAVQCRIWPSSSLGIRLFPSGWNWFFSFLTVVVIPCSPALPRWVTVAWDKPVWWNCPPVPVIPPCKLWDIVSGCLQSTAIVCWLWSSVQGDGELLQYLRGREKVKKMRSFKSAMWVHS